MFTHRVFTGELVVQNGEVITNKTITKGVLLTPQTEISVTKDEFVKIIGISVGSVCFIGFFGVILISYI